MNDDMMIKYAYLYRRLKCHLTPCREEGKITVPTLHMMSLFIINASKAENDRIFQHAEVYQKAFS